MAKNKKAAFAGSLRTKSAVLGPITFFDFISHLGRSKELSGIPLGIHEDIDEIFAIRPVSPWSNLGSEPASYASDFSLCTKNEHINNYSFNFYSFPIVRVTDTQSELG